MGDNNSTCVVCGRREPDYGYVCDLDIDRITGQLVQLPRQVARLTAALVPAAAPGDGQGFPVRATPPPPARMDVLSLLGPGSDRVAAAAMAGLLHPQVRRWRTVADVTVADATAEGGTRSVQVVTWHQELWPAGEQEPRYSTSRDVARTGRRTVPPPRQPITIGHDDQVGLVPPAAWAHSWVTVWRNALRHQPRLARRHKTPAAAPVGLDEHQQNMTTRLRLNGYVPHRFRSDDPVQQDWDDRFGQPPERGYLLGRDIGYLLTWLSAACAADVDMLRLATELRALTEELSRVLGERPDQQWLGRCPATLIDRDTLTPRPCGAGLWQDPHADKAACVRCRTVWGPQTRALVQLAIDIRRVWPLDRRRRYTPLEVDELGRRGRRLVRCPACGAAVKVTWRDVTGKSDRIRWWQPTRVVCTGGGCDAAGRLL